MSLSVDPAARTAAPVPPVSPPAARARRRTWRDPRLAVGLLLVAGSVLVGARLVGAADDTVAVLAARSPIAAGQEVEPGDLTTVRLRFGSEADADRYLPADAEAVAGSVLSRPVGAGELVPRAALAQGSDATLAELPLAVEPGRVPAAVRAGSLVDVWSAPDAESDGEARLLLADVPVVAASSPSGSGAAGLRQVVVGVPPEDQRELARVVSRLGTGLLVVRRPG